MCRGDGTSIKLRDVLHVLTAVMWIGTQPRACRDLLREEKRAQHKKEGDFEKEPAGAGKPQVRDARIPPWRLVELRQCIHEVLLPYPRAAGRPHFPGRH